MALIIPAMPYKRRQSETERVSVNRKRLIEVLTEAIEDDATSERVIISMNRFSVSVESDRSYDERI
jgi:hypothetical protein